jgi:hypothetical protein
MEGRVTWVWVAQAKYMDDEFPEIEVVATETLAKEQIVKWVNSWRKEFKLKIYPLSNYTQALKWFNDAMMSEDYGRKLQGCYLQYATYQVKEKV